MGLSLVLGLTWVTALLSDDRLRRWLGISGLAVIVFALIPVTLVRRRRLMQAERLNREVAGEKP